MVEVYTERGSPSLKVNKLDVGGKSLTNAIVEAAIRKVAYEQLLICLFPFLSKQVKPNHYLMQV